jgi:hypothetical protein
MTPRRKDSGSNLALGITIHSHEVHMRFLLFNGRPSMPANISSYQMYLATTFEVIGWWGGAATMLASFLIVVLHFRIPHFRPLRSLHWSRQAKH